MAGKRRAVLPVLVVVLGVGAALLVRQQQAGTSGADATTASHRLDGLTVAKAGSMRGYSRDKFPHWVEVRDGCDTREAVLKRDGDDVHTDADCDVTRGRWTSPYDHEAVTDPGKLDIDHVVPLADAWRSGADEWSTDKRRDFANDLDDPQLVAVTAGTNRSKGDQDPSQWKPPYRGDWCTYARDWVAVKAKWSLTVTHAEKSALTDMLGHC